MKKHEGVELPVCPHDGKTCPNPEGGCEQVVFGVLSPDGKDKVVWSCPRFKSGSVVRFP